LTKRILVPIFEIETKGISYYVPPGMYVFDRYKKQKKNLVLLKWIL